MQLPSNDNLLKLSDGRRLGYVEYGDPKGDPVFLFHGNPGSRLSWGLLPGSPFCPGLHLIAPDRPGFGLSDFQPSRSLLDWPDDVLALAQALGLERFAVIGASGGGPATLACAWKIPERLTAVGVISCPAINSPQGTIGMSRTNRLIFFLARRAPWLNRLNMNYLAFLVRRSPDRFIKRLIYKMADCDKAVIARPEIWELFRKDFPEALRQGGRGSAHEIAINHAQQWGFSLEEISVNVHLWHGEADPSVPVTMGRYLASRMPNCEATFIPKAGHLWVLDHMTEVLSALIALNRTGESRSG